MTREQMIEKAGRRLQGYLQDHVPNGAWNEYAEDVVDAILPQVTTVTDWTALPVGSLLMAIDGETRRASGGWASQSDRDWLEDQGPLTVVWQP